MWFTYYKVHPSKVYNSMVFCILTELCNHHHDLTGAGSIELQMGLAMKDPPVQILVSVADKQ